MLLCVGLRGYAGERPGFLGGMNEMCEFRVSYILPIAMNTNPCCPPPKSDSNFLTLAMYSLLIHISDRKVGLPLARVSGLCVNDLQILLAAGANTTNMMVLFLL